MGVKMNRQTLDVTSKQLNAEPHLFIQSVDGRKPDSFQNKIIQKNPTNTMTHVFNDIHQKNH